MTQLCDELLEAYVGGRLARDKNRAIVRVLEQDDVAARRAESLREAHRKLEAAFDAMLLNEWAEIEARADERATPDYDALSAGARRWSRRRLAALGLGLALLGAGLGFLAGSHAQRDGVRHAHGGSHEAAAGAAPRAALTAH
jgi:anti-sigma factor RsiW